MEDLKDVNNAEFSAEDLQLINEIQKQIDKTDSTQLVCNYEIGKLIEEAYGTKKKLWQRSDRKDRGTGR